MTAHLNSLKTLISKPTLGRLSAALITIMLLCGTVSGCSAPTAQGGNDQAVNISTETSVEGTETAIFAGGCFWCMEKPYDELPGVVSTTSGYTGGTVENPTYQQVSSGGTGHFEAMKVVYDPEQIDYETLLNVFWVNVDPLDNRGQFCDKGGQYRSAIFYDDADQEELARESKEDVAEELSDRFSQPIATEILPAATFYDAEEYHQDYYQKNPLRYKVYRTGCGRDNRLAAIWGEAASH